MILESLDADTASRRISPVAVLSDGYCDLLRGVGKRGYMSSGSFAGPNPYVGQFHSTVVDGRLHELYFTSTNPFDMRVRLLHAQPDHSVVLSFWYYSPMKLLVYVDDKYVEDMNYFDGKHKKDLIRWGKVPGVTKYYDRWPTPNDPNGANAWSYTQVTRPCRYALSPSCFSPPLPLFSPFILLFTVMTMLLPFLLLSFFLFLSLH